MGPTLLLILIDMCDLYLAAYSASEPYLLSAASRTDKDKGKGKEEADKSNAADSSHTSTSLVPPTIGSGPPFDPCRVPVDGAAPREDSESEVVVALLGGALQSLLESRFALTPAVALRSKHRSQVISLAAQIAKRLGGVLLKVLRAHSLGLLPCTESPHTEQVPSELTAPSLTEEIIQSSLPNRDAEDSGPCSQTVAQGAVKRDGTERVLEARRICVELLRWPAAPPAATATATVSDSASEIHSTGPIAAAAAAAAAAGVTDKKTAASMPLKACGEKAQSAEGAAVAASTSASVTRLFDLIDMVNQNDWLRSCTNSNSNSRK